jgi:hypothetical protein
MLRLIGIVFVFLFIVILTVLTQVGGVILLLCIWVAFLLRKRFKWIYKPLPIMLSFPVVYLMFTLAIIPLLAPLGGRVALPCFGDRLSPLTIGTCICNRHYVTPQLKAVVEDAAKEMSVKYNGSKLYYLDANFPFINGFPLLPHLSHNDGKKLDLAFFYKDAATNAPTDGTPSPIGYGVYAGPVGDEIITAKQCAGDNWYYGIMEHIVPQDKADKMVLDEKRTKALMVIFGKDNRVEKMFIEPHLKERLGLMGYAKIRFQGCHSVRHDDHVHIQL